MPDSNLGLSNPRAFHTETPRFDPWVGKIPWSRKRQSTLALLPRKSHGQRSLAGYSPWGHKESDTTESLNNSSNRALLSPAPSLGWRAAPPPAHSAPWLLRSVSNISWTPLSVLKPCPKSIWPWVSPSQNGNWILTEVPALPVGSLYCLL